MSPAASRITRPEGEKASRPVPPNWSRLQAFLEDPRSTKTTKLIDAPSHEGAFARYYDKFFSVKGFDRGQAL